MARTVSNALKAFKLPTPKSCFIWRDGVGDSSISQVASQEIPAVRAALENRVVGSGQSKSPDPVGLSYIVCQKRINTKFLTENGGKVPCGALVTGLQGPEHKVRRRSKEKMFTFIFEAPLLLTIVDCYHRAARHFTSIEHHLPTAHPSLSALS